MATYRQWGYILPRRNEKLREVPEIMPPDMDSQEHRAMYADKKKKKKPHQDS